MNSLSGKHAQAERNDLGAHKINRSRMFRVSGEIVGVPVYS